MARILLGWELGAGGGHVERLLRLARALAERGHEPMFAPQQIGPFAAHGPIWQAPVWPRLLEPLLRQHPQRPATMGDSLAYLGLDDPQAMAAMLIAWDRILADSRADVVVGDYAPMLQLAARGRIPTLACGTGFSLPPADMPAFPGLFGPHAVIPEADTLESLNQALRRTDRQPLSTLPEIFAADQAMASTFTEFDPYRAWRREKVAAPVIAWPVPLATGQGEKLFVYFNGKSHRPNKFWQALVDSRLPVHVYDTLLNADDVAMLEGAGIRVARAPVAFDQIVQRSRLLLSHGGLGFVSSGLVAGLPQIIIPFDGEKLLIATAAAATGTCLRASFEGLETAQFAAFVRAAWTDAPLHAKAHAAAPGFRARVTRPVEEQAVEMVEAMI